MSGQSLARLKFKYPNILYGVLYFVCHNSGHEPTSREGSIMLTIELMNRHNKDYCQFMDATEGWD